MTLVLGKFHTSGQPQIAIAQSVNEDGVHPTVCVLPEDEVDGMTAGQIAYKHNVSPGTDQGHFSS